MTCREIQKERQSDRGETDDKKVRERRGRSSIEKRRRGAGRRGGKADNCVSRKKNDHTVVTLQFNFQRKHAHVCVRLYWKAG